MSNAIIIGFFVGCESKTSTPPVSFEANHVYAYAQAHKNEFEGEKLDPQLNEVSQLMTEWFGTPDEPKLPPESISESFAELVKLDRLKMASGPAPASKEPGLHGLYRQQCVTCHGETGTGRGTTSASQNPYPRDFRRGTFKYKSTKRNFKPTRDDIKRTLVKGLQGTQMPVFDKLSDDQVQALIDYVIYLSIRGEFERKAIALLAREVAESAENEVISIYEIKKDGDKIISKELRSEITDFLEPIVAKWNQAEDGVEEFAPPDDLPVPGISESIDPEQLKQSIDRGRKLFVGTVANCAKCHGENGKADNKQDAIYDEWTTDWTTGVQIALTETNTIEKLMSLGALKPQVILPRNLTEGKYRGGGDAIDIYRRIRYGIEGTPMPAAAVVKNSNEVGLRENDLWDIVNFVRSLPESNLANHETTSKEVAQAR